MKKLISFGLGLLLAGCATSQVAMNKTKVTPSDRALAFQTQTDKATAKLVIVRDKGMAASACYYGVTIDQILAARMDVSEVASFKLEPGERDLKIIRDPQGGGLCSVGDDNVDKKITLQAKQTLKYRLSLDLSGQPSINPYIEE